jgi:CP family cyanate transporter-like MFS transporter
MTSTSRASRVLAIVALSIVLRPPVAAVGPLLPEIANSLNLTAFAQGILTSIPVVCFGLGAFFAPTVVNRVGLESGIVALAAMLFGGILLRAQGGTVRLFVGSALIGAAIALGNTLLPALIKQDFSDRIGIMTGTYTTVMVSCAALAAAVAVPLAGADGTDWQQSFRWWSIPAAIALLLWLPQVRHHAARKATAVVSRQSVWRSRSAWSLALFMGFQSISFYAILSWLPTLLRDSGLDATTAGALLGFSSFVGIPMGLFLPPIIKRPQLMQPATLVVSLIALTGTIGLALSPVNGTIAWLILLGIGQGTAFPLALNLITLRSASRDVTTSLSALAQGVGYLMAAFGTYAVGVAYAVTNAWAVPMALMIVFAIAQVFTAWSAANPRQIAAVTHV